MKPLPNTDSPQYRRIGNDPGIPERRTSRLIRTFGDGGESTSGKSDWGSSDHAPGTLIGQMPRARPGNNAAPGASMSSPINSVETDEAIVSNRRRFNCERVHVGERQRANLHRGQPGGAGIENSSTGRHDS